MGCLLPLFALATPRFILVVLWLFTDYLSRAYENFWLPLLGFIFLPTTTVGYAIAQNMFDGVRGWGLVIVLFGLALDLGLLGGAGRGWRPKPKRASGN